MPPIVALIRVSKEEQAKGDRTSLADQRTAVEQLAAEIGGRVARYFEEPGVSGGLPVEQRPGLSALIEHCQRHPQPADAPGHVLALNVSRWGRWDDPEEGAWVRVTLRRSGWLVRYAEGDAQGHSAPIMRMVGGTEAAAMRRQLMLNTRRGMKGSGEAGFWTRREPFGYRRIGVPSGKVYGPGERKLPSDRVKLTPHEPEAAIVRWAFERYLAGESAAGIARQLLLKAPGRRWSVRTTLAVLSNPVYLGHVIGGRRKTETNGLEREPYECRNAHPPVTDHATFEAVQRRIAARAEDHGRTGRDGVATYLLSGLLTCKQCGAPYAGGGGGRAAYSKATNERRRLYRCSGGAVGKCPGTPKVATVMRHIVEPQVLDAVTDALASPVAQKRMREAFDKLLRDRAGKDEGKVLRAERSRLQARLARLVNAVAEGLLSGGEAQAQLDAARSALADVERRLQDVRSTAEREAQLIEHRDTLLDMTRNMRLLLVDMPGAEQREVLRAFIKRCEFDKVSRKLYVEVRVLPESFPAAVLRARDMLAEHWPVPGSP